MTKSSVLCHNNTHDLQFANPKVHTQHHHPPRRTMHTNSANSEYPRRSSPLAHTLSITPTESPPPYTETPDPTSTPPPPHGAHLVQLRLRNMDILIEKYDASLRAVKSQAADELKRASEISGVLINNRNSRWYNHDSAAQAANDWTRLSAVRNHHSVRLGAWVLQRELQITSDFVARKRELQEGAVDEAVVESWMLGRGDEAAFPMPRVEDGAWMDGFIRVAQGNIRGFQLPRSTLY
ncbi:hypothetical protein QBC34DRAFT_472374 [Podospora aff. communis PSN243]|uniref:Uncharacterized protein n=1 Tax=Podospora aff. communis PSN243 TaxID=3040156 RepID=A0AAV9GEB5_9PEZI|nr:hypothetical protein QBC34DRAFT_472374 [Podospora aff. communis PSN243]